MTKMIANLSPPRTLNPKKYFLRYFKCLPSDQIHPRNSLPNYDQDLKNVRLFTLNELKLATNGFHSSNKAGEGGFGSVYKGKLQDGNTVAIKVLSAESKQGDREFLSEIVSMSNISHENLVKLHGCCIDGPSRILVYEYMENRNLSQTLLGGDEKRAKFNWKTRKEIAMGIAKGLAHIHDEVKPHIIHRDIKASNILLDRNFTPKISDFGLSKLFSDSITHITTRVAGTLGYLAPEYAFSGHVTRKSDVYSFGVLLIEIVSGRTAVDFDIQHGEHYLVEKAWEMYKCNKLEEVVDKVVLSGSSTKPWEIEEAVRYLKVGLLCVQEKNRGRPNISIAMKMMRGEVEIGNAEIPKPGLITDFMNVKVSLKPQHNSQRSFTSMCSPYLQPFLLTR